VGKGVQNERASYSCSKLEILRKQTRKGRGVETVTRTGRPLRAWQPLPFSSRPSSGCLSPSRSRLWPLPAALL
jgi:hypothetical protein